MNRLYIILLILAVSFTSCNKFVEVPSPTTKVDVKTVFASDAAAISLMTGIYSKATSASFYSFPSLSLKAGLSADELVSYGLESSYEPFYKNALNASSFSSFWAELYNYIYTSNLMIEGLNGPNGVSLPVKTRLEGEAKFMRAYFYFYLVNFFGDVPLITSTTYTDNALLPRTPVAKIYELIIQDLKDAQSLLGTDYTGADLKTVSADRVRPNKWAATAMLARVYLFKGDYSNAITESSKVINQTADYTLESLDNTFLKSSKETIFSLQSTTLYQNTLQAYIFILTSQPNYSKPMSLSDFVYNAFEPGDKRKTNWVGSFTISSKTYRYAYKYKVNGNGSTTIPVTENEVLLRLAEQYLIRAEAYIQTAQIPLGITDLNTLRTRSRATATTSIPNPLPPLSAALLKPDALQAVEHERQVELFTESGDRWLTLKRMRGFNNTAISRADEIMPAITAAKGGTWNTNWQLYPIPKTELTKDKNIVQNPGYN